MTLNNPLRRTGPTAMKWTLGLSLLCLAGSSIAFGPQTDDHKFDAFSKRQAARAAKKGWFAVIIKFHGPLRDGDAKQLKSLGVDIRKRLDFIGSAAAVVPNKNLRKLAALSFVKHVSADVKATKSDEFVFEHSFANLAYSGSNLTGEGVTVAVVDSGIEASADLNDPKNGRSRVLANVNFAPDPLPGDPCGHGTHVAGITAGNGSWSSGPNFYRTFYGIARKANLVNVRVLDKNGQTYVSTLVTALNWVLQNKQKFKIRVVNLSMGHPVGDSFKNDPLCQAVETLWKNGIVVVCAAGNEGRKNVDPVLDPTDNEGYGTNYGSIHSPGNDPYVITVGAMKMTDGNRDTDKIATYSSRGPSRVDLVLKPDLVAPGNQVISLRRPNSELELFAPQNIIDLGSYNNAVPLVGQSNYFKLSGTSMAAPVVAGAVALMLQANPTLSPDTVKLRLMMSADKWLNALGDGDPCTFGAGYLNVTGALASPIVATSPALSPALKMNANGQVWFNVDTNVLSYDNATVTERGNLVTTKPYAGSVYDLRAIWGSRAIWGENFLEYNRALWGESVWMDKAIWGTSFFSSGNGPTTVNGE